MAASVEAEVTVGSTCTCRLVSFRSAFILLYLRSSSNVAATTISISAATKTVRIVSLSGFMGCWSWVFDAT